MTHTPWFPQNRPPQHPDRVQLYAFNTPNGQKVSIMLEELGTPYEYHRIDITKDEQHDPDYLKLSPNGKIPTLSDPHGPNGQILVMESAAILLYLADKNGKFLTDDPEARLAAVEWLFFQMGHVGPMLGQFGHFFKFARDKTSDEYALNRYSNETRRLLGVLDKRLAEGEWIMGADYTIVDMATYPWVDCLETFYKAADHLQLGEFQAVNRWRNAMKARPAVARGMTVLAG